MAAILRSSILKGVQRRQISRSGIEDFYDTTTKAGDAPKVGASSSSSRVLIPILGIIIIESTFFSLTNRFCLVGAPSFI